MVSNKKLLLLCLLQYLLVLGYHIIYSIIFCSKDQTVKISVWSLCILAILVFFGYIFQKQVDLVVYVTMVGVIVTVSYVGYFLSTLAYSIMIYFAAGLILSMFIKRIYVVVWSVVSTLTVISYTILFRDIVLEAIPSIFLFYGYVLCYLIGNFCIYILVSSAGKYLTVLEKESEEFQKENLKKNYFWANISNEIRTPMNVINGMSRLLKNENLNVRAKEYTDQIENASDMLLTIVNDTLELSSVETGAYELKNEPYDIYRVVHMAAMYSSVNLNSDNTNLVYCINSDVPSSLIGDEDLLTKVLIRLLNNAMFFTEQGEVRLNIETGDSPSANQVEIVFKVSDEGGGISSEGMQDLFTGFDSINVNRTTEQETIGLSLKLCKSMIGILGGELSVETTEGKGSVFIIRLVQTLSSTDVLSREYETSHVSTSNFKCPNARVLVVDDTPTNLKLISGMIRLHGIEPDNAESGRECISMMENKRYDLIFLDYMMPDLNGVDTLKSIRQKEGANFVDVPIIALTSKSLQRDRTKFIEFGFDEFISKPIDDKELENLLQKFLSKIK